MTEEKSMISSTYTPIVPREQIQAERRAAAQRIASALSPGTRRVYATSWRFFEVWCEARGRRPASVTIDDMADYLEWRLRAGLSPRSCVREYSGIAQTLRTLQPDGPWREKKPPEQIKRWLQSAQRKAVPAVRKQPLLPDHFAALAQRPGDGTLRALRDRALLLFGFGGAFRRSELVALNVADVEFGPSGAHVQLRRSKTDQEGKGQHVAVWRQSGRQCPVAALETYLRAGGIESGPIFRALRHDRPLARRLNDRAVAVIVKEAVASLGLDPDMYAGHSLRCGFVTAAATRGASIDEIMHTTRHESADQVIEYVRRADPFERNASRNIFGDAADDAPLPSPPVGFEAELGGYGPQLYDQNCGVPLGWGFRLLRQLGEPRLQQLRTHGELVCISMGNWALITKWLTAAEAIAEYGPITSVERGPRGGFRAITFGTKRFVSRRLAATRPPGQIVPCAANDELPPLERIETTEDAHVLSCGRGHVHEDPKREGSYCLRAECARGRGRFEDIRQIRWRAR